MPFSQKHHLRTFQCNYCARTFDTQRGANIHVTITSCSKKKRLQTPQAKQPALPTQSLPTLPSALPPASTSKMEHYPGAARILGHANTALDDFNADRYAQERIENLYYPWSSREEWQLARFLLQSSMSLAEIDEYLKLEIVSFLLLCGCFLTDNCNLQTKRSYLSFKTSKKLIDTAWLLPPVPPWKYVQIPTDPLYPAKAPFYLHYRDAVEVLEHMLKSPLVRDYLHFEPLRIFKTADKTMRVYESWLSSNRAWDMQVCQTLHYLPNSSNV